MQVTELAPLRSLLECLKEPTLRPSFTVPVLCNFVQQIAEGMAYLENKRLIHRDLAARNILVFAKDKVGHLWIVGRKNNKFHCDELNNVLTLII